MKSKLSHLSILQAALPAAPRVFLNLNDAPAPQSATDS